MSRSAITITITAPARNIDENEGVAKASIGLASYFPVRRRQRSPTGL
jgi:hypothetical protein